MGPVATLARGLRDLRDNAEGPDGVELELLTSLPPDVIAEALRGVELPTLAVTVALVDAWGGDVEAWALYWTQINEIAVRAEPSASGGTDDARDAESGRRAPDASAGRTEVTQPVAEAAAATPGSAPAPAKDPWRTPEPSTSPKADEPVADEPAARDAAETIPAARAAASDEAETKVVPKPTLVAAAAESAPVSKDKPTEQATSSTSTKPAKPAKSTKALPKPPAKPSATEPKSHRGLIIVGAVVLVAGVGGVLAYSAVHHDAKKPVANATSPTSPRTSRPSASHAPTPTASAAPASTAPAASSEPTTSAPTTATTSGASYPPGYEIGSYPNVQLPSGYSLDFSADPSHPTFGTSGGGNSLGLQAASSPGSEVSPTDSLDTGTSSSGVSGRFLAGQAVVFDSDESGTFERCLNDTRYQADVDLAQLSAGAQFCVHTTGGRLVLVRVDRMPQASDANPYAVLDVTIWQG
jgi:hypothetical protein